MEHTPAVDDYLKVVYSLLERGDGHVGTSALAGKLGVSASSVSGMVRRLVGSGLVAHRPYGGITLTADGTARALQVLRRHRLLECYLVSEAATAGTRCTTRRRSSNTTSPTCC